MQHPDVFNPFVLRLGCFAALSRDECGALARLTSQRVRQLPSGEDVIREGECPRVMNVLLSGWACRYKQLDNGRRQILSLLLPGDVCDANVFLSDEMDHSIAARSPISIAEIPKGSLATLREDQPRLAEGLQRLTLVDAAVQREWAVSLGQRTAAERMAHLLCELFIRLRAVDLVENASFTFPLKQTDLADALGLSAVHINRTLQELRGRGLIRLRNRELTILDFDALAKKGIFNPAYLRLERRLVRQ